MDEPIKWDSFITPGISFSLGLHLNTANALPAQQTIRVKKMITSLYMYMFMKPEDGNLHRPPKDS